MAEVYLLDTNAITAIFKKDADLLALITEFDLYLPVIVVGELFYGALYSQNVEQNLESYTAFISQRQVLSCDLETARQYGAISVQLRRKGRNIPQNDVWIAALALQYDLPVITRDKHFNEVDGLTVVTW